MRPKESAPTDGTEIVVWDGQYKFLASFEDGQWVDDDGNPTEFTHWFPEDDGLRLWVPSSYGLIS